MNTERLLKLADFLETVPEQAFTLDAWEARAASKPEGDKQGECGFAGCAMGWAAHAKLFPGLILENGSPVYRVNDYVRLGFGAAEVVFDIPFSSAVWLFYRQHYTVDPTPADVAQRIRTFLQNNTL